MTDLAPRYHWLLPEPYPLAPEVIDEARRRGLSARALRVLSRRGPVDGRSLAARFDDPAAGLCDPRLLPDAEAALARVEQAVAASERVLVLGDFDADGLTGLAILTEALRRLGLEVETYVPHRTAEGHGLSSGAVSAAVAHGCSLIMTADTGSSSVVEVDQARRSGVDVIITDHHALPPALPRAVALVNPHRQDSRYPDDRLSGAGVAFKVAQLLLGGRRGGEAAALEMADLAAIGSIADVVPITGENLAIVRLGLQRLAEAPRPGLAALIASARIEPSSIDAEDVGYGLAPRINAMGRVGDPSVAAELLLAPDAETAQGLAARLEAANVERRALMSAALDEARQAVAGSADQPFVMVCGDWPVGVIGLVAGRLAEELGRPTLVLATGEDPWRGSARSAGGFDLAAAFESCSDLLDRHGGHPAAAGCHLASGNVDALHARLIELAEGTTTGDRRPSLAIDLVQSALSVDHVLLRELALVDDGADAPPLVGVAGLTVIRARPAKGGHTQLTLRRGTSVVDGISFGWADLADQLQEGQPIDVVARLRSRNFAGLETLQLEVRDAAPAGRLQDLRPARRLAIEAVVPA